MIEDLGNVDQMTFLADYLFRAGATVVPLRPVGHQTNEVVLDNDDAGVTFAGAWSNSTATVYFGSAGDVPYRVRVDIAQRKPRTPATSRTFRRPASIRSTPGRSSGSDRATDQLYRVNHSGGITEVTVNHRRVGNGLVYLGTYYFDAGTDGYVDISNRSNSAGQRRHRRHDPLRQRHGRHRPRRRRLGLAARGRSRACTGSSGTSIARRAFRRASTARRTIDRDATVSLSPRYAEYMNREADGALAGPRVRELPLERRRRRPRRARAATTATTIRRPRRPTSSCSPTRSAQEVNDDMVAQNGQFEHDWFNRGTNVTLDRSDIEFGEINNLLHQQRVRRHDRRSRVPRQPAGRRADARPARCATRWRGPRTRGSIKYFRAVDGNTTPATAVAAAGDRRARRIERAGQRDDFLGAAGGQFVRGRRGDRLSHLRFDEWLRLRRRHVRRRRRRTTTATLNGLDPTVPYYFKVVAVNAGGESPASEVVAALPSGGAKQVLIVNGFDRLDRTLESEAAVSAREQHGRSRAAAAEQLARLRRASGVRDSRGRRRACTSPARATRRSSAAR